MSNLFRSLLRDRDGNTAAPDPASTLFLSWDWPESPGAAAYYAGPLLVSPSGTGARANNLGASTQNPWGPSAGVASFTTGTTATGSVRAATQDQLIKIGQCRGISRTRLLLTALSDAANTFTIRCGFSSGSGEPLHACYFRYTHGLNSGRWAAVNRKNNVETSVDTGVDPATQLNTWVWFETEITNSSAIYRINGNQVAEISSNMPDNATLNQAMAWAPLSITKTVGVTARDVVIDYCDLTLALNRPVF